MHNEDKKTLIEIVTPQSNLLSPGDLTECEGLFPPEFWTMSSRGARKTYGYWIARLVAEKALPLEPCGFSSKRHNRYRRI
jgi:hypothetical protein